MVSDGALSCAAANNVRLKISSATKCFCMIPFSCGQVAMAGGSFRSFATRLAASDQGTGILERLALCTGGTGYPLLWPSGIIRLRSNFCGAPGETKINGGRQECPPYTVAQPRYPGSLHPARCLQ